MFRPRLFQRREDEVPIFLYLFQQKLRLFICPVGVSFGLLKKVQNHLYYIVMDPRVVILTKEAFVKHMEQKVSLSGNNII